MFGGQGLGSNLKKKPKKVHLQSNPDETKNKKTPPSFSKCPSLAFRGLRLKLKNGQNLKKFTVSDFDETKNQRTHYSQNTTYTIKIICHWCLEVLGSTQWTKSQKIHPYKYLSYSKLKILSIYISYFFLKFDPRALWALRSVFKGESGILSEMCLLIFSLLPVGVNHC